MQWPLLTVFASIYSFTSSQIVARGLVAPPEAPDTPLHGPSSAGFAWASLREAALLQGISDAPRQLPDSLRVSLSPGFALACSCLRLATSVSEGEHEGLREQVPKSEQGSDGSEQWQGLQLLGALPPSTHPHHSSHGTAPLRGALAACLLGRATGTHRLGLVEGHDQPVGERGPGRGQGAMDDGPAGGAAALLLRSWAPWTGVLGALVTPSRQEVLGLGLGGLSMAVDVGLGDAGPGIRAAAVSAELSLPQAGTAAGA